MNRFIFVTLLALAMPLSALAQGADENPSARAVEPAAVTRAILNMNSANIVAPAAAEPLRIASHQHLDVAWLWPRVPFGEELALAAFERIPFMLAVDGRFRNSRSTAWAFDLLERRRPALFAQIAEEVKAGRVELVGGWWVEADEVMPSTESLLRQGIYGQWYFRSRFGKTATVGCNPDCFGHGHAMPQLYRQVGLDSVYYLRCLPKDEKGVAHPLSRWVGPDGSEVIVMAGNWVNPMLNPQDWERRFSTSRAADGGFAVCGLRSDRRVNLDPRWFERLTQWSERLPRPFVWSRFDEIVKQAKEAPLPVVRGELGFVYSGTYTSEGGLKSANRALESRLRDVELWNLHNMRSGGVDAQSLIDACWRDVLLNQFHDIQAGSGSQEMHAEAHALNADVSARLGNVERLGWTNILRDAQQGLVVLNPSFTNRSGVVLVEGEHSARTEAGAALPSQVLRMADGRASTALRIEKPVPATGGVQLTTEPAGSVTPESGAAAVRVRETPDTVELDNGQVRVVIRRGDGACVSFVSEGREWVKPGGAFSRLVAYEDFIEGRGEHEHRWESWIIRRTGKTFAPTITFERDAVQSGACLGLVRCQWDLTISGKTSRLVLEYRLWSGDRALQVHLSGDWQTQGCLLKLENDIAGGITAMDVDMPGGVVARPAMPVGKQAGGLKTVTEDGPIPLASDEDPDQVMGRWVDARLADGTGGVAFLNNGRHGYDARPEGVGLSLLRGPRIRAEEVTGLGPVSCQFEIFPHNGDWRAAGVDSRAEALHHPLVAMPGKKRPPSPLFSLGGDPVEVLACKQATFGPWLVVRLHERQGREAEVRFDFNVPVVEVRAGSALEDAEGESVPVVGGKHTVKLRPHEIRTLLFGLQSFM